ncbi:lactose-binding lectin l-2-like [Colossoma macropomum]|uniref:lactose-binding lectin l-2-like n=1 Tax=Colossoma macropomum TaxID=42526 RepID=UPI001864B718|nr:lactose-binding lectin l-2-like [Colossoma macropomum]
MKNRAMMAGLTKVTLLFIVSTAATALARVVRPVSADFEAIIEEAKRKRDATTQHDCPLGWVKLDGRCFSYHASSMDWASAENYCLNQDANLVSIHSETEYQLIKALIRAHDPAEKPVWIGLSCCQKRNNWMWSDGTKLTFTKWNPNEPSSEEECCVHMNWSDKKDWNDIRCESSYPFVCVKWPTRDCNSLNPFFPVQNNFINWQQYIYNAKQ